jgi:hypothetical protein
MTGRDDVAGAFLEKLLLCVHRYGTNTGIRAVAAAGAHGHREHELYYLVRRYLTPGLARALYRQVGTTLGDCAGQAATAVASGDFTQAATAAQRLLQYAEHVQTAVVRDALASGADWWQLGEHLSLHPQAAYEQYRGGPEGLRPPAEQRPHLTVVWTAGLLAEHDRDEEYGIDLEDLGNDHSLSREPGVVRLRESAAAFGEDVWIAVRLPGGYEGADNLDDGVVASRCTTVVIYPDELGWWREALRPPRLHRSRAD